MTRLINADTLIAWIKGSQQMTSKMKSIICYIKTMPTIDAVSVVRCKDCKYKYMYKSVWECPYGLMITADGYCNYGERKESE